MESFVRCMRVYIYVNSSCYFTVHFWRVAKEDCLTIKKGIFHRPAFYMHYVCFHEDAKIYITFFPLNVPLRI